MNPDFDSDFDTDLATSATVLVDVEVPAPDVPEDFGALWGGISLLLVVALTALARKITKKWPGLGGLTDLLVPSVAILIAVFLRAVFEVIGEGPVTASVLLEGATTGAFAVYGHAQFRKLIKKFSTTPDEAEEE